MKNNHVIIVEDDPDVIDNLSDYLSLEGFEVTQSLTAQGFFEAFDKNLHTFAIVDLGLPDQNGYEIVKHVRDHSDCTIIILTAKNSIQEKLQGYESGADYYFVKPLDSRELVAVLNRKRVQQQPQQPHKQDWIFDKDDWTLTSPEKEKVSLTAKEFSFLNCLINANGDTVKRHDLLEALDYEVDGPYGNKSLDVMVTRLRKKIRDASSHDFPIKTHRSVGYSLNIELPLQKE